MLFVFFFILLACLYSYPSLFLYVLSFSSRSISLSLSLSLSLSIFHLPEHLQGVRLLLSLPHDHRGGGGSGGREKPERHPWEKHGNEGEGGPYDYCKEGGRQQSGRRDGESGEVRLP